MQTVFQQDGMDSGACWAGLSFLAIASKPF